jgi:methylase of polypeptide subunit release factors
MNNTSWPEPPLRLGTREDFAQVFSALTAAGFDEATVCRTLKIEEIAGLNSVESADILESAPALLALFIKLFLFVDLVPRAEVESVLDRATLDALLALDLLRIGDYGEDQYYTPVFVYPVAGLIVASDRHTSPDGSPFTPPEDVVFPAIFVGTLRFLRIIPKSPCDEAIDLCSGSGVGALVMSKHVQRVIASDITTRAAHFARFNSMLNDCHNIEPVIGDLFSAVAGRTFDRITAHPPYMPTFRPVALWRDGGETGEALLIRIIKELPRYLRPGATSYIVTIGLDTEAGPFEERVRRWLGPTEKEFDIIFAFGNEVTAEEIVKGIGKRDAKAAPEDLERLQQAFKREQTVKIIYGALAIHRRVDVSAQPWTVRTRLSTATTGADFEWAFEWHRQRQRADFLHVLAGAKPCLSPHLRVRATHVVFEGNLVPTEFILESDKPFISAMKLDGPTVPIIARFDGQITPAELYQTASEELEEGVNQEDFLKLVAVLVDRGYLILDA